MILTKAKKRRNEQDRVALEFIKAYAAEHGEPPSYIEIGTHLGLSHPNNAKRNCDRLVSAGLLSSKQVGVRAPGRHRILELVDPPRDMVLPFRGRVSCGSGAEPENCEEEIDLRDYLKVGDSAVFRASGESMIDAQIASGDLLIVSEDPDPPVGSVVVALVGEEMVCKQLARKTSKTVHLKPCSGDQKPLILDTRQNDVQILGVLRNVVRKV